MFALVDCNTFYVSCERVFQPQLEGKPVIVLSSNDGCAIARSNEAKALGIKMGIPLFKIKDIIEKHHVHVFSANFTLYGDISARVMAILRTLCPFMEIYSIDEAFLNLSSLPSSELYSYGCHMKKTVKQCTGIPVSVGIGPTKTLAKVANSIAKKSASGCYVLDSPDAIETILRKYPIQEIWGIGTQWSKKLETFNIRSAFDLAKSDIRWIRKAFNVMVVRTVMELRGISCLSLEEIVLPKKSMLSSRSFGTPVTTLEGLHQAASFHASSLARRLREERSKTSLLNVFISTSRFDEGGNYYRNSAIIPLPCPSYDNATLIKAASLGLAKIYRNGLSYKKAGVIALNLTPEDYGPNFLFTEMENETSPTRKALLKSIDELNERFGRGTLKFASEGIHHHWRPKAIWKTQSFTTNWKQLPKLG